MYSGAGQNAAISLDKLPQVLSGFDVVVILGGTIAVLELDPDAAILNQLDGRHFLASGRNAAQQALLHRILVLCVPKTLSVLMWPRNHLSWRNDRDPVFRRGGLGLTIQVEDPA
jgi:hypothetical protein